MNKEKSWICKQNILHKYYNYNIQPHTVMDFLKTVDKIILLLL